MSRRPQPAQGAATRSLRCNGHRLSRCRVDDGWPWHWGRAVENLGHYCGQVGGLTAQSSLLGLPRPSSQHMWRNMSKPAQKHQDSATVVPCMPGNAVPLATARRRLATQPGAAPSDDSSQAQAKPLRTLGAKGANAKGSAQTSGGPALRFNTGGPLDASARGFEKKLPPLPRLRWGLREARACWVARAPRASNNK